MYNPVIGRWFQEDPIGFEAGDTNKYRYVFNNPTNLTDPSGLEVRLYLRAVEKYGVKWGYHVRVVAGGDDRFVEYNGGGEQDTNPMTGRPNHSRDERKGWPDTTQQYYLAKSPYKTPAEEIAALDKVYEKLQQLPYRRLGPNSNTYARQLLELAGFEVHPIYRWEKVEVEKDFGGGKWAFWLKVYYGPTDTVGWNNQAYGGEDYTMWGVEKAKPVKGPYQWQGFGPCFEANTLVHTKAGVKPIQFVYTEESVLSWNEGRDELQFKPVIQLERSSHTEVLDIIGSNWTLRSSLHHPFLRAGPEWAYAKELREGDFIRTTSGVHARVVKVQKVVLSQPIPLYNFKVEDNHTYCVTDLGIIVHNKPP